LKPISSIMITTLKALLLALVFSACSESSDTTPRVETAPTIKLSTGNTQLCTHDTQFSVIPEGTPKVEFTTNAQNGDTKITVIEGDITIVGCTK
jgi:hypothetical protein